MLQTAKHDRTGCGIFAELKQSLLQTLTSFLIFVLHTKLNFLARYFFTDSIVLVDSRSQTWACLTALARSWGWLHGGFIPGWPRSVRPYVQLGTD